MLAEPQQQVGRQHGGQERHCRDGTSQLLGHDRERAHVGPGAAEILGYREAGHTQLPGQVLPRHVVHGPVGSARSSAGGQ